MLDLRFKAIFYSLGVFILFSFISDLFIKNGNALAFFSKDESLKS